MNLFLTVGTQLPFDRLTRAMDQWCAGIPSGSVRVFGQIGPILGSNHTPKHFEWTEFLAPDEFGKRFEAATHIVAHAGMGTIISAMVAGKPIAILPRRKALGEQRNDHQVATVRNFVSRPQIFCAEQAHDLPLALDRMLETAERTVPPAAAMLAEASLTDAIRAEIMT